MFEGMMSRDPKAEYESYCNSIDTQIAQLAPSWLEKAGAGNVPSMNLTEMSESEAQEYKQFYFLYYAQGYKKPSKKMKRTMMTYLKGSANKIGDDLDRDYIMLIDFYRNPLCQGKKEG